MEFKIIFKIGLLNAWIFMSVFILQMFVVIFTGDQVRKRCHVPESVERFKLEKYIGVIANVVWFLALAYSIFLPFKLGTVWFYIGLVVFIVGLIFISIATYNFINTPLDQLITTGVYKLSRHPMYLATILVSLASGIASGSIIFVLLTIIMALCFHKEALVEERFCLDKFGEAYRDYQNNVSRWIWMPKTT